MLEKVIYIYGGSDNCSNACREILKVMQEEATANDKAEINTLKVLIEDRFCGRVIGKGGRWIKKIQVETDSKITVANYPMVSMQPDSVIFIKSNIVERIMHAESLISAKIRECYDQEQQAGFMHGYAPPVPAATLPYLNVYGIPGAYPNGGGGGGLSVPPREAAYPTANFNQLPAAQIEVCDIWVPNSVMGAIIGTQGSTIKEIIRLSNAYITIEPKKDLEANPTAERKVTIKGFPGAFVKAYSYIHEKLRSEGYSGIDELRQRTAIYIPKAMVGRVIGKNGRNVQEIQRQTGAMIKLPEAQQNQSDETTVEIFGTYMDTLKAIYRVREVVNQAIVQATPFAPSPAAPHAVAAVAAEHGPPPPQLQPVTSLYKDGEPHKPNEHGDHN